MFVEVILPLPIYSTFTYSVPAEMQSRLSVGSRVLVQFGRKKFYTAVVSSFRSAPPSDYEVKPVIEMLDPTPVVRFPQLKLWDWVAEYYLCSPGEVMRAALPSGLKPESETTVTLNPDFEAPEGFRLTERMESIVSLLETEKKLRIAELENKLAATNLTSTINRMLEAGIVELDEKLRDRYRPKKLNVVELLADRTDPESLHPAMNAVARSPKQQNALMAYLDMSGWMNRRNEPARVLKEDLMKRAGVSPAVLKSMQDKGIFRITRQTVNRFSSSLQRSSAPVLPTLSEAQEVARKSITDNFRSKDVTLLRGVTGSGKTEIYAPLMNRVLEEGKQVHIVFHLVLITVKHPDIFSPKNKVLETVIGSIVIFLMFFVSGVSDPF